MQKFNLHTHTFRCGHASGTDDQMVLSAIEAGFEQLGFSDHMPYPELHLPTCRMAYDQLSQASRPDRCISCGQCAAKCPQHIDIPAVMARYAQAMAG